MTAHFVYVLKGWIEFRFDGIVDSITVLCRILPESAG
jgi:hypothetical protein